MHTLDMGEDGNHSVPHLDIWEECLNTSVSLERNHDIDLKQLLHKLLVLLALSNASRASEYVLDIRYLSKNKNGVVFTIT